MMSGIRLFMAGQGKAEVRVCDYADLRNEYGATAGRLVGHGADAPLAKLFAHVAREVDDDDRGVWCPGTSIGGR